MAKTVNTDLLATNHGKKRAKASWLKLSQAVLLSTFVVGTPLILSACSTTGSNTESGQDSRSLSTMLYDETIEKKSVEILATNTLLSKKEDTSISFTSFNGNVLVTGQTVNRDYLKWVVKQIEQLEHVRKVYNYATLQKPVPASVVSSDAYITSEVKAKLLLGKGINSNRFKVVTENGNVYLMGIVTHDESTRAINTVLAIKGVRKVYHVFDYIETSNYTSNGAQADDSYHVTPVKGNRSDYQAPQRSSTYVPPVQTRQNGGAYILEDGSRSIAPAPVTGGANGSSYNNSSYVAPASYNDAYNAPAPVTRAPAPANRQSAASPYTDVGGPSSLLAPMGE